jgi:gliding motility-associated-like protein
MRLFAPFIVIVLLVSQAVHAQVCNGSLGDPVLNETFGAGHYQLPAYKTTYDYAGGCPDKGTYTTTGFIFGCGPHTWTKITGDHTGDLNGNCMLVNAESTPGTVYRDTVKELCGSTVYQFGVWVTGVMTKYACDGHPVLPNLYFTIKSLAGVTLAMDSTGYLPIVEDKNWQFFGFSFITPANIDTAIVSITINPAYGCGSVFALDDVTLRPCGSSVSATIDGTPGPANVCADYTNPMFMTATYAPGFNAPAFQWQSSIDSGKTWVDIPGETTLSYKVPHRASGQILYRICMAEKTNINSVKCRIVSNVITTSIHPLAAHIPPQTVRGCLNKDFVFPESDPHALQVLWTGPGGYSSTAQPSATITNVQYADSGLYRLKQTFYFNCTDLDTFYLQVFPGTTVSALPVQPLCEGNAEQLTTSADGNVRYQWTPSAGLSNDTIANPLARPLDSTIYKLVVTNGYGCKDSVTLPIYVYRNPVANTGPGRTMLLGDTIKLASDIRGTAITFNWSPPVFINDVSFANPLVYPNAETVYTLTVASAVGCGTATGSIDVKVYKGIFVPGAFTPNGDGRNDVFEVTALAGYRLAKFVVYSRLGQKVFDAAGVYRGWDGTINGNPQPPGAYIYDIEIVTPAGRKIKKQGTVLLIR